MKCDAYARLRHRIKRAGVRPKPTPNAAAPSFGSIQTAKGTQAWSPIWRTVLRPVFKTDFENAAVSRVFRYWQEVFSLRTRRRFGNQDRCTRNLGRWRC